jgi:hypothetical protein
MELHFLVIRIGCLIGSGTEGTRNTVRFRTRLADRCAKTGGTVARATSASAYLGPSILFSTANVTNAGWIAH